MCPNRTVALDGGADALHPVLDGSDPAVLVTLDSGQSLSSILLAPKHSLPYHAAVPKRQLPKAGADALRTLGREGGKKRAERLTEAQCNAMANNAADARWRMALERPALDLLGVDCGRTASGTAGERVRT